MLSYSTMDNASGKQSLLVAIVSHSRHFDNKLDDEHIGNTLDMLKRQIIIYLDILKRKCKKLAHTRLSPEDSFSLLSFS